MLPRVKLAPLALVLALIGDAGPPGLGTESAFIWQRHWSPALDDAIAEAHDLFPAWHVLAGEIGDGARLSVPEVNWTALGAAVPVIRIEPPIGPKNRDALLRAVRDAFTRVPVRARATLEIDHDAATAHLADYAAFLRDLRATLRPRTRLTATALPTWLRAPSFPALAGAVDGLVLQLHSVSDPRTGLFDPTAARLWIARLAARSALPFAIALPAYGARVVADARGRLLAVEGEAPVLDGEPGIEEAVAPRTVADFLERLRAEAPPTLRGIVWFRLPVATDRRAWHLATLRAVIGGALPPPRIDLASQSDGRGFVRLYLRNRGDVDSPVPARTNLPPHCPEADGAGPFSLQDHALVPRGTILLPPHTEMFVGWARCAPAMGIADASP